MPITKSQKARYPANWNEIRARIQIRANDSCEWCGVKNYSVGYRNEKGDFYLESEFNTDTFIRAKLIKIVCTTAHINHTPEDNSDSNLAFLCQRCHLTHDAALHAKNAAATRRRKKGNLELFSEVRI